MILVRRLVKQSRMLIRVLTVHTRRYLQLTQEKIMSNQSNSENIDTILAYATLEASTFFAILGLGFFMLSICSCLLHSLPIAHYVTEQLQLLNAR